MNTTPFQLATMNSESPINIIVKYQLDKDTKYDVRLCLMTVI